VIIPDRSRPPQIIVRDLLLGSEAGPISAVNPDAEYDVRDHEVECNTKCPVPAMPATEAVEADDPVRAVEAAPSRTTLDQREGTPQSPVTARMLVINPFRPVVCTPFRDVCRRAPEASWMNAALPTITDAHESAGGHCGRNRLPTRGVLAPAPVDFVQ